MKLLTLLLISGLGTGFASQIPVPDNSFENIPLGFGDPVGWTLFNSTTSPTFTSNVRIIPNDGSVYPTMSGVDGSQLAAVSLDHNFVGPDNPTPVVPANGSLDGLVSGNLGTFSADTLYTLTASVGFAYAFDDLDVGLALGTGAPGLADVFPSPPLSAFAYELSNGSNFVADALQIYTVSLDTAAFPDLVGQSINASLIFHSEDTYGRAALFDNVSLSSDSDAPEPNTMLLLATAGMAIFGYGYRVRRRA
jgi:hypothetical protein